MQNFMNIIYILTTYMCCAEHCVLTFGEIPFSAFPWFSLSISMQVLSVIKDALMLPKESKKFTRHC